MRNKWVLWVGTTWERVHCSWLEEAFHPRNSAHPLNLKVYLWGCELQDLVRLRIQHPVWIGTSYVAKRAVQCRVNESGESEPDHHEAERFAGRSDLTCDRQCLRIFDLLWQIRTCIISTFEGGLNLIWQYRISRDLVLLLMFTLSIRFDMSLITVTLNRVACTM